MVVYSKEYLEEWEAKVVEPHVMEAQKMGIDALKADNMTDFVLAISRIAQDTENHVDLNCICGIYRTWSKMCERCKEIESRRIK